MTDINQFIKDTTTASFSEDVIEASSHSLVIVDFWAPWCGPCKQLTPTLEKIVGEFGGNVLLCKVNVDENQAIAAQMGIQSIPAVFAFRDQKPIDGFMGNITEDELRKFFDKHANTQDTKVDELLQDVINLKQEKNYEEALTILESIATDNSDNIDVILEIADCYLQMEKFDFANDFLASLSPQILNNEKIRQLKSTIELSQSDPVDDANISDLIEKIEKNPSDHQSRIDLSLYYNSVGDKSSAADLLIKSIHIDREWNEKAAQSQLLKFFEAWGFADPVTVEKRKDLSAILFS
tara:strand:+ start:2659 stop:3540 length:882 start_codon:yes stop_codon:yes gene_type:complete